MIQLHPVGIPPVLFFAVATQEALSGGCRSQPCASQHRFKHSRKLRCAEALVLAAWSRLVVAHGLPALVVQGYVSEG